MTTYTVGLKLPTRTKALTIEAEDALLAALGSLWRAGYHRHDAGGRGLELDLLGDI
jgi:hypothetical protein